MADKELVVSYQVGETNVQLMPSQVKDMLTRGNGKITDQEVFLFIKLCEAQKLNPFTNECYLIKFNDKPAQMVVGYGAYVRRAEENPMYLGRTAGITVQRGDNIVQKEGAALYPSEKLIAGWCKVKRARANGGVDETFEEVSMAEYDRSGSMQGDSIWKTKPCTMIKKTAVSQALRAAFPTDFNGLYTAEEFGIGDVCAPDVTHEEVDVTPDMPITQEKRKALFSFAQNALGKDAGNDAIKVLLEKLGITSTAGMYMSTYETAVQMLDEIIAERLCAVEKNEGEIEAQE